MGIDLKGLFGEDDALSAEELEKRIKAAGMKLADLSEGKYVLKEKFEAAERKAKQRIAELEQEKQDLTAKLESTGSEGSKLEKELARLNEEMGKLQKELETERSARLDLEQRKAVAEKVKDARFQRLALLDARELAEKEELDFAEALEKVLEENPDYVTEEPAPATKVSTGRPAAGKDEGDDALTAFAKGLGIDENGGDGQGKEGD